jgi:CubicO group peptidase (beta-lactamase class C family)
MGRDQIYAAIVENDGTEKVLGSASSLFPWWSFTKTVLAICSLRLAEEGLIDLNELRPGQPFTLRQLLQHCAGVPEYGKLQAYHDAVSRSDPPWSRARLLEEVQSDRLDFEPGTGWAYSNLGYLFVRDAIEEVTGLNLATALKRFVTGPLGLQSVQLAMTSSDFSTVHWAWSRKYDPAWVYHGCLTGTSLDAAKILHALFHGQIMTSDSLQEMLDIHPVGGAIPGRPWTSCGYGLGLMWGEVGELGRVIGHSGTGPFCASAVYHFPDLATPVTIASFTEGSNEGLAEFDAVRLAHENS